MIHLSLPTDRNWDPEIFYAHADANQKMIEYTISDIEIGMNKIMVCGRGTDRHPDFSPRLSTATADIDSDLYVTVDHHSDYDQYVTRPGNYALSVIVDPSVPKKVAEIGGKVFWFSPEYMDIGLPKIVAGKFPYGNSGLACVMLASFFGARHILLSGIGLTGHYTQFLDGKDIVFETVRRNNTTLHSLDGILCEKTEFEDWCAI